MFPQVSVCSLVCLQATASMGSAFRECASRGIYLQGFSLQGGLPPVGLPLLGWGGGFCHGGSASRPWCRAPPPRYTVNRRAVRILQECILVFVNFEMDFISFVKFPSSLMKFLRLVVHEVGDIKSSSHLLLCLVIVLNWMKGIFKYKLECVRE